MPELASKFNFMKPEHATHPTSRQRRFGDGKLPGGIQGNSSPLSLYTKQQRTSLIFAEYGEDYARERHTQWQARTGMTPE